MEKLSVTIITYNEEGNIRDALESVKWADEIVVVDCGSDDSTVRICREYTDRVFYNPWPGHVQQKNFAIDKTTNRWVFSIDADERVTKELAAEIRDVLNRNERCAYAVARHVFYLGRWINHSGWYPDYKVRLFPKDEGRWGGTNPHDKVIPRCEVRRLRGDLLHYTYRDISHHVNTMNSFTDISAVERSKMGDKSTIFKMLARPVVAFVKKLVLKQGFRDGVPGLVIAVSSAYYVFLKYAKLWELGNVKKD